MIGCCLDMKRDVARAELGTDMLEVLAEVRRRGAHERAETHVHAAEAPAATFGLRQRAVKEPFNQPVLVHGSLRRAKTAARAAAIKAGMLFDTASEGGAPAS